MITLVGVIGLFAELILLHIARQRLCDWSGRREARAIVRAQFPTARSIALSRADKRGFATGRDGVMRPR